MSYPSNQNLGLFVALGAQKQSAKTGYACIATASYACFVKNCGAHVWQSDVLIAAIKLTALPGIFIDEDVEEVEYYHLLFDQHQVIIAEGAPSESLFTGPHTLSMLSNEAREEIFTIFPELRDLDYTMVPAAFIPAPKQQKHLIARHGQNQQPLLM